MDEKQFVIILTEGLLNLQTAHGPFTYDEAISFGKDRTHKNPQMVPLYPAPPADPWSEEEWEKANEYCKSIGRFGYLNMVTSTMDVYRAKGAPGYLGN